MYSLFSVSCFFTFLISGLTSLFFGILRFSCFFSIFSFDLFKCFLERIFFDFFSLAIFLVLVLDLVTALFLVFFVSANAADLSGNKWSFYSGTFDFSDDGKKSTLVGFQHQNENLNRDTFLGKFKPVSGGFVTGDSSIYLYTGIEGQYGIGPLKILPSFAPGYYEKGDGKDLGSVLEFKSELKVGLDIFENSKLSYSYSHISNNDWGDTNPGTDNQQITFSKNF